MAKGKIEFESRQDTIEFIIFTMMGADISIQDLDNEGVL